MKNVLFIFILALGLGFTTSCSTVYYNFWETLGKEKRDLLKSNVLQVNNDQKAVQQEFKDTLEKIRSEYKFDGGNLEKTYDKLSSDYSDVSKKTTELSDRIEKVEDIAENLFEEWQDEAHKITNESYRKNSLEKRKLTKEKFKQMLASMNKVKKSLKPMLVKFNDQVLYLKHNLNAKAIGAFKTEFKDIESGINQLSKEIEKSTSEADKFIGQLQ